MKDSFADVLKDMRSLVGNAPPDGRITVDTLEHFYQRLDGVAYYSGQYAEEQAEAEAQAKEFAHRPGPWHVSEHTDGRDALIYDEDGFEVARVCYPNRDADAKLIAAAPGLLAAARAALHYMRLHKYADQAWADDLEAAIAAAMTPNAELTGRGPGD